MSAGGSELGKRKSGAVDNGTVAAVVTAEAAVKLEPTDDHAPKIEAVVTAEAAVKLESTDDLTLKIEPEEKAPCHPREAGPGPVAEVAKKPKVAEPQAEPLMGQLERIHKETMARRALNIESEYKRLVSLLKTRAKDTIEDHFYVFGSDVSAPLGPLADRLIAEGVRLHSSNGDLQVCLNASCWRPLRVVNGL
jgi:hypothetical protein